MKGRKEGIKGEKQNICIERYIMRLIFIGIVQIVSEFDTLTVKQ